MPVPITIVDYDPGWPARFEALKTELIDILGERLATVEHIGSTSVPGLGAKPIIDILAGVRTMADAERCIAPLQTAGWEYVTKHEATAPMRRYFCKGPREQRAENVHLHMVETSNPWWWERHLVFRDYLRAHPDAAADYERLKRDLAAQYGTDRAGYTSAKTDFIRSVEVRAYAWANVAPPIPEPEFFPLTPDRWPDLEALFGPRGATAGCWCMWWRIKRSDYDQQRYEGNRLAFKAIVDAETVPGLLAYVDGKVVGWCAVQPREAYPALDRSRVLKRVDDEAVWSITCFFIARPFRRKGITDGLIRAAIAHVRRQGGALLEAYPVAPKSDRAPDFGVFTGMLSTFQRAGFVEVARRSETRPIVRYTIPSGRT